jgi:hypothetical protein
MEDPGAPYAHTIADTVHQVHPSLEGKRLKYAKKAPPKIIVTEPASANVKRVWIVVVRAPITPLGWILYTLLMLTPLLAAACDVVINTLQNHLVTAHATKKIALASDPT